MDIHMMDETMINFCVALTKVVKEFHSQVKQAQANGGHVSLPVCLSVCEQDISKHGWIRFWRISGSGSANYLILHAASHHVQPVATGCIIFWGSSCAADAVPSIIRTLVLISPTLEG